MGRSFLSNGVVVELAEIILLFSALLLLIDLLQSTSPRKRVDYSSRTRLVLLACGLVIASYALLVQAFLSNNFLYEEVYFYSSSSLAPSTKLYASWAGSGGSWLFLTFLLALGYLFARIRFPDHHKAHRVLSFFLLFFILIILTDSPFKLMPGAPADGGGLNPLLQTPWMIVHPPIVFAGYVLVLMSFALSIEVIGSRGKGDSTLMITFSQMAWLFLSLGIVLGGIWAYEVLGWGGYWAWDPVETASLIPWLTLTAYFHLPPPASGRSSSSRATMIMITSSLVIFATAVTRGGMAVSVHAFGSSPIGYVLLSLIALMAGYFVYYQRRHGASFFDIDVNTSNVYSVSMLLGFASLIMLTLICLWGISLPIAQGFLGGTSTSMSADFFNRWAFPFTFLFVISLIGCQLHSKLNTVRYSIIISALAIFGAILVFLRLPTPNALANFGFPSLLASLAAVVYGMSRSVVKRSALSLGRGLIHLGVVLILIGVFISSTMSFDMGVLTAKPGIGLNMGGTSMEFGNFTVIQPFGKIWTVEGSQPEAAGLRIPVTLRQDGAEISGMLEIFLYSVHGVVSKPLIIGTIGEDFYIVLVQTQPVYVSLVHGLAGMPNTPNEFSVSVKTLPQVNLIWIGAALMCIGIIIPMIRKRT